MMYGFGFLSMILFWGLVVLGAMALISWLGKGVSHSCDNEAMRILRARYAKGEISAKEYQERKKILQN